MKSYTIYPFGTSRKLVSDSLYLAKKNTTHHLLIELDITDARIKIKEYRKKYNKSLSVTAYLLYCFSRAIDNDKTLHAMKGRFNKMIAFNDVDVFFPIEATINNKKSVIPYIIRAANTKSLMEIENDIQLGIQLKALPLKKYERQFINLPFFIKKFIYDYIILSPHIRKRKFGTVYMSTGGLNISGGNLYALPIIMQSAGIFLGSLNKKLILKNGILEERTVISASILGDHLISDGGPAIRGANFLKKMVESASDEIFKVS